MPKLKILNRTCLLLIGAIKTSFLYRDIRNSLKQYYIQYEILRELIYDIYHFRISKDESFDNLMKEVNDL